MPPKRRCTGVRDGTRLYGRPRPCRNVEIFQLTVRNQFVGRELAEARRRRRSVRDWRVRKDGT